MILGKLCFETMRLETITKIIQPTTIRGPMTFDIEGIAYDSRQVRPNYLCVAVPGQHANGARYIDDAIKRGAVAIALKRASLFGRGPMAEDLEVAYTLWGFLDPQAPAELVDERRRRFEGVHHTAAHYPELRALADAVPSSVLALGHDEIASAYRSDWRAQLDLS